AAARGARGAVPAPEPRLRQRADRPPLRRRAGAVLPRARAEAQAVRAAPALAILLAATAAHGQAAPEGEAPTVAATLDRSEIYVGDRVTLSVSAVARDRITVSLPSSLELGKV